MLASFAVFSLTLILIFKKRKSIQKVDFPILQHYKKYNKF